MAYLEPADYSNYGLPAGTTADWITAATALINSYCRRPDLNVIQYIERARYGGIANGAAELFAAGAAGAGNDAPGGIEGRYARPRRGEIPHEPLTEIAWAFSLPGQWTAIDRRSWTTIQRPAS